MVGAKNQVAALAGLPNMFQQLAVSPIKNWQQAGIGHKVIMIGSGVGVAYLLRRQGADDLVAAAAGLGAAYSSSMLMHYPAVAQRTMAAPTNNAGQTTPAISSNQMQQMVQRAENVLQEMVPANGALPSRNSQRVMPRGNASRNAVPVRANTAGGLSTQQNKWDILDLEVD